MSQSTIRNIIISSILLFVAAGALGLMVYRLLWQGEQLTTQIATLEEERAQESTYYYLLRLSEETLEDRTKLEKRFLLKESDSIDFLNQVEKAAPQAGVLLETDGLESITDPADKSEWIKVRFKFTGSRGRVQQFIKILETLPYVLRLTEATVEERSATEWSASVTMQVRVLAYDE